MHASPVVAVSLMLSETLGLFALSNPCVTRGSTFVDDFCGHMGCLLCLIHASPVEVVSMNISDAAGAVYAVESMRQQWKQFR
jgi:hypothetical protein